MICRASVGDVDLSARYRGIHVAALDKYHKKISRILDAPVASKRKAWTPERKALMAKKMTAVWAKKRKAAKKAT